MSKVTDLTSSKDNLPLLYFIRLRDEKAGNSFGREIKVRNKEALLDYVASLEGIDLLDIKQL